MDINTAVGRRQGIPDDKLEAIESYADHPGFTDSERAAIAWAEMVTISPNDISEAQFAELRRHFTEREIVELTAQAAFENFRARFNRSLRIEADDLAKRRAKHPAAAPSDAGASHLPDRGAALRHDAAGAHVGRALGRPSARRAAPHHADRAPGLLREGPEGALRPAERRAGDPRPRRRPAARRGGLPGRAARLRRHALRPHARERTRQALLPRQDPGLRPRAAVPDPALPEGALRGPDAPPARRPVLLGRVVLRRRLPGGARPQPPPRPLRARAPAHAARAAGAVRARQVRGAGTRAGDPLPPRLRSPRHPVRGGGDRLRREGRRARRPRRPDRRGAPHPPGHVVGQPVGGGDRGAARDARAGEQAGGRARPRGPGDPRLPPRRDRRAARGSARRARAAQARGADALRARTKAAGGPAAEHPPQPARARPEAPALRARRRAARVGPPDEREAERVVAVTRESMTDSLRLRERAERDHVIRFVGVDPLARIDHGEDEHAGGTAPGHGGTEASALRVARSDRSHRYLFYERARRRSVA